MVRTNISGIKTRIFEGHFRGILLFSRTIARSIHCKNKRKKQFSYNSCLLYHENFVFLSRKKQTHRSTRFEEVMVQNSFPGHLDQFSSSKQGSGCHYGRFMKHRSMDNFFSKNSLKIIEMFRIKDNFIWHKDVCLMFKDFSTEN